MTTKQFQFSLYVSILLVALGAVLVTQTSTGLSLIGLGLFIAVLSILSRDNQKRTSEETLAPIVIKGQGSSYQ